jgi:hypothetical protein
MTYKHTQTGWVILAACLAAVIFFGFLPTPLEAKRIVQSVGGLALLLVAALFATLTVEVDEHLIQLKFGVGLVKKSFRLEEITSCRAVRNQWWWGWGVRLIPGGWLYNVSGLDAVELVMKNGKKFRIGTDEPKALADAIQAQLNKNA